MIFIMLFQELGQDIKLPTYLKVGLKTSPLVE
jgi:hypothetical protein